MKKLVTLVAATAILAGTAATAQDYKKEIKARQGLMQVIALNLGTLGAMAKGQMEYDAAVATAAGESLQGVSMVHFASLFPEGSDGGMIDGTTAKDSIAADVDGFNAKWEAFGLAATKAATEAGNGQEAVGPILGALGATCSDCHKSFRIPQ
ncbi:cytochrome c [Marinovum sp. 2_MG-2023]|uniref:c-type cytochrome n=1 Tax=unclassified Marinovum TaxID=2647166 RepID=UPI0026E32729|nr:MULTISPECIES: cytochrome c [unclassified Marinovum]MDO6731084.1 cytochrome c [Marinovum sp. 2_MG-2023]MDO6778581.1 cytochrome c [Marinovum sp. 1_MG-2023]